MAEQPDDHPHSGQRRVLGVWAHPDDEVYLSAGLMARSVDAGNQVTCVTATRGELGTSDPLRCPPERLAAVRTAEAAAAMDVLGVRDHRWLDLPDGGLEALPVQAWVDVVGRLIDELQPDTIVTFGPDGMTGHPDHVAVSRWTTAAWAVRGGPGQLHYAATVDEWARAHARMHRKLGVFGPGLPASVPADRLSLAIRLDDAELDRKRAALRCHASQTDAVAQTMGERGYRRWWSAETFRTPSAAEIAAAVAATHGLAA